MPFDIPSLRLANQQITRSGFAEPAALVAWLGAVQSQDYAGARWALGLRLPGSTDAGIEQAFQSGELLRTHVMRPTWHFVTPADIRWMLALTAPRVNAFSATYYRKMELDDAIFRRSNAGLEKALRGGKQLTRAELGAALRQAGLLTDDLRLTYMVMRAELDAVICNGPRQGKQFTYALLEERVPPARKLDHDEALAELARRYFTSHGPATPQDFAWWSGLSAAEASAGLALARHSLTSEQLDGKTYWFAETRPGGTATPRPALLLPNFDEYTVAYTDRSAISVGVDLKSLDQRNDGLLNNTIILDGQVAGTWKRRITKTRVEIELRPYRPLDAAGLRAIGQAAESFGAFLGLPVVLANP